MGHRWRAPGALDLRHAQGMAWQAARQMQQEQPALDRSSWFPFAKRNPGDLCHRGTLNTCSSIAADAWPFPSAEERATVVANDHRPPQGTVTTQVSHLL